MSSFVFANNEFLKAYEAFKPVVTSKYSEYRFKLDLLNSFGLVVQQLFPIEGSYGFLPGPQLKSAEEIAKERKKLNIEYTDSFLPWVNKYGWAIPTDEALEELGSHGPILEIGAGQGYWAYLLNRQGVDVVAYDNHSWKREDKRYAEQVSWFDVKEGTEAMVPEHPERNLFLCYPPMGNDYPLASKSLQLFSGNYVFYVGGVRGGLTGDGLFYDALEKDFDLVKTIGIPAWPGHDVKFYVYLRKGVGVSPRGEK